MFLNVLKRSLIYMLMWAITMFSFYLIVWKPNVEEIEALGRQISINRKSLSMIQKQIKEAPEINEEELNMIEKSLDLFLARIPAEVDLPDILERVRELGIRRHGLRINSLSDVRSVKVADKKGGYSRAIYRLIAEGDFRGMVGFIRDLESSQRLISIESFSIKARELDLMFAVLYCPIKAEVKSDGETR